MRMRGRLPVAVALAGTLGLSVAGQAPQPPRFEGGVRLLTAEAAAFDKQGHPVRDLIVADFRARIDGRPAAVRVARVLGRSDPEPPPASAASPENVNATAPMRTGRSVIIALDETTLAMSSMRRIYTTAAELFEALPARDAVGLYGVTGEVMDLTHDHRQAATTLRQLAAGDLSSREAYFQYHGAPSASGLVQSEAAKLHRIETLLERLAQVPGPKYVVWFATFSLSGQSSNPAFQRLGPLAAKAHVFWLTVDLHGANNDVRRPFDMSRDGTRPQGVMGDAGQSMGDPRVQPGLRDFNAVVGGSFYSGQDAATAALSRVTGELEALYELGIEPDRAGIDDQPPKIEIEVTRPGVRLAACFNCRARAR